MKRKIHRRSFADIRKEQDRHIANYIENHADRLAAKGEGETAAIIRGLASSVKAGLAT